MRDPQYGFGITFVDIDETLFHTHAKVLVYKDGKLVKELTNQEFNTYTLTPGESFSFEQFRDGKFFYETSQPITSMIEHVKMIIDKIDKSDSKSRVIFLTAREDFFDKEPFLETFREQGIPIDKKHIVYIERSGNRKNGSVAQKKREAMLDYLREGIFRRCRIIDDAQTNIDEFEEMAQNIPEIILQKVRKTYNLPLNEKPIRFFSYLVDEHGNIAQVKQV